MPIRCTHFSRQMLRMERLRPSFMLTENDSDHLRCFVVIKSCGVTLDRTDVQRWYNKVWIWMWLDPPTEIVRWIHFINRLLLDVMLHCETVKHSPTGIKPEEFLMLWFSFNRGQSNSKRWAVECLGNTERESSWNSFLKEKFYHASSVLK